MITQTAIFFGSIGSVVDTSDMQRRAFNIAFEQAGLDWNWTAKEYAPLLATVGGVNRIRTYAAAQGATVDADALHADKSRIYQQMLRDDGVALRPGVAALIDHATEHGMPLGWITTTSRANVDAIIAATGHSLEAAMFDLITDRDMVSAPKPNPEVYRLALTRLGLGTGDALVIEDTPESATAARAAGLDVVAFEGAAPPGVAWPDVVAHVSDLSHLLDAEVPHAAAG